MDLDDERDLVDKHYDLSQDRSAGYNDILFAAVSWTAELQVIQLRLEAEVALEELRSWGASRKAIEKAEERFIDVIGAEMWVAACARHRVFFGPVRQYLTQGTKSQKRVMENIPLMIELDGA